MLTPSEIVGFLSHFSAIWDKSVDIFQNLA